VELSDEHVIPKSIGGYYHIYNVCKKCNSSLGAKIDPLLVDSPLLRIIRYTKKLVGHGGKNSYPQPFSKPENASDGTSYYISEDEHGRLHPHVRTNVKCHHAEDGSLESFTLTLDAENEHEREDIIKKICERNNIQDCRLEIVDEKRTREFPTLRYRFEFSATEFILGMLKIAYEFTCDCIPEYEYSEGGQLLSRILIEANPESLDKVVVISMKIAEEMMRRVWDPLIDFSSTTDRHYLFLDQSQDGIYCIVNLFNEICIGFLMDTTRKYQTGGYVYINDILGKCCEKLSMEDLVTKVLSNSGGYTFEFSRKQYKGSQKLKHLNRDGRGLGKTLDGYVLLLDSKGDILGSVPDYLGQIKEDDKKSVITSGYMITRYFLPKGVFVQQESSKELIPIDRIEYKNQITKY
jgi:hypothetical protein